MTGIVCGFSGRIGSGKTSISEEVARHLNWPRVSFGDYVRKVATEQGIDPTSRTALQDIGASLINNGIEKFCLSVLAQADWKPGQSLVVDGIRHQDILIKLKEIVLPSTFVLVYINVEDENRAQRVAQRDGLTQNDLNKIDRHSTERDAKSILMQLADITINGNGASGAVVSEIVDFLTDRI